MKNQALVTAVSGLLIGGFGIANRINALSIAGTGLLTSSVVLTLIDDKKQNQSTPQITTTIPQAPKKPEVTEKPEVKKAETPQVTDKPQPKKTEKPKLVKKPQLAKKSQSPKAKKPQVTDKPQPKKTEKPTIELIPRPIHPSQNG
ncbi:hypothetical protein IQ215_02685 [Cyanobacterium stanieri LEGE 03274]|uniref:Uncharacterized protein n=1 Tax=Cyanobacterium stanieri LEGE 03274 TaxID=1828756 RepID=A0ABR9V126_9CHRO|nr:hypothetical protein [Cyanobacterium stanieri]MBE9221594.1 hypothetical protein [Cyanobacterium stanieri LEGE 03274]